MKTQCSLLFLAAVVPLGCRMALTPPPPPILVSIQVTQQSYTPQGDAAGVSDVAYHVKVFVKNVSADPFIYDSVYGMFLPANGTRLRLKAQNSGEMKGNDSAPNEGSSELSTLATGETVTFNFTTNGHTSRLLKGAGAEPLRFGMKFSRLGLHVGGRIVFDLPPLQDVPRYEDVAR